jgi:hypothetical protein
MIEHIQRGKRNVASLFDVPSGKVLLVRRTLKKLHCDPERGRKMGLNEAIEAGKAAWTIEEELIGKIRREDVRWFAVLVPGQDLLYVVDAKAVSDPKQYYTRPQNKQGGYKRCIPLSAFECRSRSKKIARC